MKSNLKQGQLNPNSLYNIAVTTTVSYWGVLGYWRPPWHKGTLVPLHWGEQYSTSYKLT